MSQGRKDLFATRSERVLGLLLEGASIADAAREAGVHPSTVKAWLRRGREAPAGEFGGFASSFDAAQEARRVPAPSAALTLEELAACVATAARAGSVQAMRLGWELLQAGAGGDDDPLDEFDFAALRRANGH